ncbi:S1 RNA-binding domain-containing protein [Patescibacteria group bacterium]|nr:S1 RNA-binding domain-containing protein [Patescibacteria group bacterium]
MTKTTDTKSKKTIDDSQKSEFKKLMETGDFVKLPNVGDLVKGKLITISKSEAHVDIDGLTTGIVRGREFFDEASEAKGLKPGDVVEATVLELENENGEMELSFRYAGHQKAWEELNKFLESGEVVKAKIMDANKGGLMVKINMVQGFLPVSQLSTEHYPRVPGGDKNKILERLKSYIGQSFNVKIITAQDEEDKLIVSEKSVWDEQQKDIIAKFKVGEKVETKITAVTDFGVFVEFGEKLEGLVHISELAWQRIDDPRLHFKVGEKKKAEIITVDGSKIFLSFRKLIQDPWHDVDKKYKIGQIVKGKVIKTNPFGVFVELDADIHGLAHISELADKPIANPDEIAKPGDMLNFKILSIEPVNHRLGLSLKGAKAKSKTLSKQEVKSGEEVKQDGEKPKLVEKVDAVNTVDKDQEQKKVSEKSETKKEKLDSKSPSTSSGQEKKSDTKSKKAGNSKDDGKK